MWVTRVRDAFPFAWLLSMAGHGHQRGGLRAGEPGQHTRDKSDATMQSPKPSAVDQTSDVGRTVWISWQPRRRRARGRLQPTTAHRQPRLHPNRHRRPHRRMKTHLDRLYFYLDDHTRTVIGHSWARAASGR
jgi:hypothetical protein